MKIKEEIIDCGGKYEVHPGANAHTGKRNGLWCVVNSESGEVRTRVESQADAVAEATRLNDDALAAYGRE